MMKWKPLTFKKIVHLPFKLTNVNPTIRNDRTVCFVALYVNDFNYNYSFINRQTKF